MVNTHINNIQLFRVMVDGYPMCTLITAEGSLKGLISVTVHESIHSWFKEFRNQ